MVKNRLLPAFGTNASEKLPMSASADSPKTLASEIAKSLPGGVFSAPPPGPALAAVLATVPDGAGR
jgi:hypothetical protein